MASCWSSGRSHREIMEERATGEVDIEFPELAHLDIEVKETGRKGEVVIQLKNYVVSNPGACSRRRSGQDPQVVRQCRLLGGGLGVLGADVLPRLGRIPDPAGSVTVIGVGTPRIREPGCVRGRWSR